MDFNTEKRKHAVSSFEKYFFKLINKSVYVKTMEYLRKRVKVTLVNDTKDYKNMEESQILFQRRYLTKIASLFLKFNQF